MLLDYFLEKYFIRINSSHESFYNDFSSYENFKKFINEHYNIDHLKQNNYIKYVKVKRHMMKLNENNKYNNILNKINSIIQILVNNGTFPCISIKRYMFRLENIIKLVHNKRYKMIENIHHLKELYNLNNTFKFRMILAINTLNYKYIIFTKYSNQLIYYLEELMKLEYSYGIDHKLININNLERSFLGKKSEYIVNKIILEYIEMINNNNNEKKYYYETNIDLLKFLSIKVIHNKSIKGEIDGMIISYDGSNYVIEKIIEVKSSIKSTFEDIDKFIFLQEFIKNMNFDETIYYNQYVFNKNSFVNIINKMLHEWSMYICINNIHYDIIEKSHIYFTKVLKIIDDKFIENYYIKKNEDSIVEKYNIILKNVSYIDILFEKWKKNINFDKECNIFIIKK